VIAKGQSGYRLSTSSTHAMASARYGGVWCSSAKASARSAPTEAKHLPASDAQDEVVQEAGHVNQFRIDGRSTYRLTPAGTDLAPVLAMVGSWNQRWFPLQHPRKPPVAIVEAARSHRLTIG
jgi:hypothetical protein